MKVQTKLVKSLKEKVLTALVLVKLGVKKYIIKLVDLEQALESAISAQFKKTTIRFRLKTGFVQDGKERREASVFIDGNRIDTVLKAESTTVEICGKLKSKGMYSKWSISEYEIPLGSPVMFRAFAVGQSEAITHKFIVGEQQEKVDSKNYSYSWQTCGWIVEIN